MSVVGLVPEKQREAVLFARERTRIAPDFSMASPYVALHDRDPLALEIGERRRRHILVLASYENRSIFEIRLREDQRTLAFGVFPRGATAVERIAEEGRRKAGRFDDGRVCGELDPSERSLNEIQREAGLSASFVNGVQAVETRRNGAACGLGAWGVGMIANNDRRRAATVGRRMEQILLSQAYSTLPLASMSGRLLVRLQLNVRENPARYVSLWTPDASSAFPNSHTFARFTCSVAGRFIRGIVKLATR